MTEGTCAWCNKSLPQAELKRCVQCLAVCYCSRECQKNAWVNGHKKSCTPRPKLGAEKDTSDWGELDTDKALTRWLDTWRSSFCHFAVTALDLANHPANYNATHAPVIWVTERVDAENSPQRYKILRGGIWPIERCDIEWPQLDLGSAQNLEYDGLRFIVILEDQQTRPLRARALTARTTAIPSFRGMHQEASKQLARFWLQDLAKVIEAGDVKTAITAEMEARKEKESKTVDLKDLFE
ncbi:hypothetical protein BDN72DRAFT_849029 [Pluteus cervinus]|uniref:Uncharacterized protein n=1 Tax=Pluteus cervinus TaxID=181527 RepID=A0ACD3A9L5_9AGAR|nr:hypothetical protein BDN72DRAFT_849029 [Pluteus cervinus]